MSFFFLSLFVYSALVTARTAFDRAWKLNDEMERISYTLRRTPNCRLRNVQELVPFRNDLLASAFEPRFSPSLNPMSVSFIPLACLYSASTSSSLPSSNPSTSYFFLIRACLSTSSVSPVSAYPAEGEASRGLEDRAVSGASRRAMNGFVAGLAATRIRCGVDEDFKE